MKLPTHKPSNLPLPLKNLGWPFPGVTAGRQVVANLGLSINVPDARPAMRTTGALRTPHATPGSTPFRAGAVSCAVVPPAPLANVGHQLSAETPPLTTATPVPHRPMRQQANTPFCLRDRSRRNRHVPRTPRNVRRRYSCGIGSCRTSAERSQFWSQTLRVKRETQTRDTKRTSLPNNDLYRFRHGVTTPTNMFIKGS